MFLCINMLNNALYIYYILYIVIKYTPSYLYKYSNYSFAYFTNIKYK